MTRSRLPLLAALLCLGAPALAAEHAQLTVVTAGSEQALKLGSTLLSRPFAGQLVDRIAVAGRYALPEGETAWLVRGEGAAGCPVSYVVVATRHDQAPAVSAPFSTCRPLTSAAVRSGELVVRLTDPSGAPVSFVWSQGAIRPVGAAAAEVQAQPATACSPEIERSPELLAAALDATLTPELRRDRGVKQAELDGGQLQGLVSELACLSGWPGADRKLYEAATPLFASRKYGRSAFAALDTVARTPGTDVALQAAVRRFSAQMYYFVAARQPL